MVFHSEDADHNHYQAAEERIELGIQTKESMAVDVGHASQDAGHSINLLAEDQRHLIEEDIADDTATGTVMQPMTMAVQ